MGAVEMSIERSGREDVMKLDGTWLVRRSFKRSGKWGAMKEGGL